MTFSLCNVQYVTKMYNYKALVPTSMHVSYGESCVAGTGMFCRMLNV